MTSVGSAHQQSCTSSATNAATTTTVKPADATATPSPAATVDVATVVVQLLSKAARDRQLVSVAALLVGASLAICLIISFVLGALVFVCFVAGLAVATVLLHRRDRVAQFCAERWSLDALLSGAPAEMPKSSPTFGPEILAKEPWKALLIDSDLDLAVDSFFSRILTTFIDSWYVNITDDPHFLLAIRQHLREALSHLIVRVQRVDIPRLCTDRLLPACFTHYDLMRATTQADATSADAEQMAALPAAFCQLYGHTVHPAVRSRRCERDYLRQLADFLVPRLCPTAVRRQQLDSAVFQSLLRELFAQWALLPLMDVLADPNLINQLVLVATNRSTKVLGPLSAHGRVEFLGRFVSGKQRAKAQKQPQQQRRSKRERRRDDGSASLAGADLLTDQTQLYSFMQYLKREGAVDVLRFYLDVGALNADLLDPKVTTDPDKLSALQQQSERLLSTYREMQLAEAGSAEAVQLVRTLAEAHELVRDELLGRWQRGFRETAEYYRVVYGDREIRVEDVREPDVSPSGFRLGSKLKGALRSAMDGSPLDGAEVPMTAWDADGDESPTSSTGHLPGSGPSSTGNNHNNIYSSVTQKLRKERGHRLDQFIANFLQSIEHVPDLGVDAAGETGAKMTATAAGGIGGPRKRAPPGRNPTFGDLFQVAAGGAKIVPSTMSMDERNEGPSGCLIFILVRILNVPALAVRFVLAIVACARSTVDRILGHLIGRLLRFGVYEPRLTLLITTLEHHLFDGKKHSDAPGHTELAERRRQARQRLGRIHAELPHLVDALQSPALNKQLMYTMLDAVLAELWPELDARPPVAEDELERGHSKSNSGRKTDQRV